MFIHELFETNSTITNLHAENAEEFIMDNCRPWLNQTNNGQLYVFRGIQDLAASDAVFFTKNIRLDRKPTDTHEYYTKAFNLIIEMAGGQANRNNSLFCTGNHEVASSYGRPFIVLPIGDFNYTWSPFWKDWYNNKRSIIKACVNDSSNKKIDEYKSMWHSDVISFAEMQTKEEKIITNPESYSIENIKKAIKVNTNIHDAIESHNEIMIRASKALYVSPEFYINDIMDNL